MNKGSEDLHIGILASQMVRRTTFLWMNALDPYIIQDIYYRVFQYVISSESLILNLLPCGMNWTQQV